MAPTDVPKPQGPDDEDIVGPHWPTQSETNHGQLALDQLRNGLAAHDMSAVSDTLSSLTSSDFVGQTGEALTREFTESCSQLLQNGSIHFNRGAGLSAMAQNILNTKLGLTGVSEEYQAEWTALQAKAISSVPPMTQQEFDDARQQLLDKAKQSAQTLGDQFKGTHSALNGDVVAGNAPSIPASMPPTPPGAPSLPGVGGNFGDLAKSLPQAFAPLQQMLQTLNPSQLAGQAQQLASPLMGALKGFQGGNNGGVPINKDTLNKLISSQGGTPLGTQGASLGSPKGAPGEKDKVVSAGLGPVGKTPDDKDKVVTSTGPTAASPVNAEEASAAANPPETAPAQAHSVATTLSSGETGPEVKSLDDQHQNPSGSPATTLSSSDAPQAAANPSLGAAQPGGAPMPMGGAPMMGGMGMGGGDKPLVSVAGAKSDTPVKVTSSSGARPSLYDAANAKLPRASRATEMFSDDDEQSSRLSLEHSKAARTLAAIQRAHRATGASTNIAVAQFSARPGYPDGRTVFVTSDGLGFLPYGVKSPRSDSLASLGLPDSFRRDWLGCAQPARVLMAAVQAGIIDQPDLVVATTADVPGVEVLDQQVLDQVSSETPDLGRDAFPLLAGVPVNEVLTTMAQAWNANPEVTLTAAEARSWASRWTGERDDDYRRAFAQYLISDAMFCLQRGDRPGAEYALWHLVRVPN